jgi:catechol 2,3-dioxygenase-like lactoylglutathione lyase family enzyme
MVLTHFVSDDVERSRRFYTEVLGGTVIFGPVPTNIALANTRIIINTGGGPTDDKPTVTLETPSDPDRVSSFLNIRVADIHAAYAEWSARGAQLLTPPKQHAYEIRCYIRDPDGAIIEVGQITDPQGDWWQRTGHRSTPAGNPTEPRLLACRSSWLRARRSDSQCYRRERDICRALMSCQTGTLISVTDDSPQAHLCSLACSRASGPDCLFTDS